MRTPFRDNQYREFPPSPLLKWFQIYFYLKHCFILVFMVFVFLAVLSPCCFLGTFSSWGERGLLYPACGAFSRGGFPCGGALGAGRRG